VFVEEDGPGGCVVEIDGVPIGVVPAIRTTPMCESCAALARRVNTGEFLYMDCPVPSYEACPDCRAGSGGR
jgi:hypothetical protein